MGLFDNSLTVKPDTLPRHIKGITCDAHNCVFHDGDGLCTAERVNIGNIVATSSAETRCATFEPRSGVTRK